MMELSILRTTDNNPREQSKNDGRRINKQIRASEVRLVMEQGETEIVSIQQALQRAADAGLDLIEVSPPNTKTPVCKIADYGRMMYEIRQKEKEAKKKAELMTQAAALEAQRQAELVFKDLEAAMMAGKDSHVVVEVMSIEDQVKSVVDDFFKCEM